MAKTRLLIGLLVAGLLVFGVVAGLQAATINLYDDFPDYQGQNGLYVYAYNGTTYAQLQLTNLAGNLASYGTPHSNYYSIPLASTSTYYTGHTTAPPYAAGWIFMHPASGNYNAFNQEDIVLGYQASQSDLYNISGAFMLNGPSDDGISVYIENGSSVIWSAGLSSEGDQADFSINSVSLSAGDFLYFGIDANGNDVSDWGHLQGVISTASSVPLPGAVLFLAPGLIAVAAIKRRFTR